MKKALIVFVLCFLPAGLIYAGEFSRVELNDGSIISAEVVALDQGVYTLDTASLGMIKVDAGKIRSISAINSGSAITIAPAKGADPLLSRTGSMPSGLQPEAEELKTKMFNNPQVMQIVTGLMADPQFQQLLKDPAVIKAAEQGDVQSLMRNEKFMNMLHHPRLEEIKDKLAK